MDSITERLASSLPEIHQIREICQTPSVTFGVVHHGRVIFKDSIGHRAGSPSSPSPDADTKYMIGSCSKMFTSAAAGILVHEGKLAWTDPISKYIPEFNPVGDARIGKEADLIDCLRHSTGLTSPSMLTFGPKGTILTHEEDLVPLLNMMPTVDDQGEQRFNKDFRYNNFTVGLVALAIQRVSGQRFADFIRERILLPLGMHRTAVTKAEVRDDPNVAVPCVKLSDGSFHAVDSKAWPCEEHTPLLAATGIHSSLNDMLTWCIAVLDAERCEAESESNDPATMPQSRVPNNPLKQMTRVRRGYWTRPSDDPDFSKDTAYCMGWWRARLPSSMLGSHGGNYFSREKEHRTHLAYILGKDHAEPFQMVGHTGGMRGSIFSVFTFPGTQSAVVTMTNGRDYGDASDYAAQLLIQALFDLKPRVDLRPWARIEAGLAAKHFREKMEGPWAENRRVGDPERDISFYVGEYRGFDDLFTLTVIARPAGGEKKLAVVFNHHPKSECPLLFYKSDTHSFLEPGEDIQKLRQVCAGEYTQSLLEFQVPEGADKAEGLWWQWDKDAQPAWFERVSMLPN
ncbi:beta-lactamase/transpeptidase-like protein [Aspergillus egyptiacus]|nr:beta-lactamase/transpeptidase-like protein [Aspergillus egyptiacus]